MDEIIKVNMETETVSARELYDIVSDDGGTKGTERFSKWFERYCSYGFKEGYDFSSPYKKVRVQYEGERSVSREVEDYDLSMEMAKQICMLQRSEKGMELRQYFIDLEKAWNTPEQIMSRALKIADKTINSLRIENAKMKPKAEFFDAVAESKDAVSMADVAKVIGHKGMGRNNLFEFLRDKKVLDNHNQPYQRYVDAGYFRVIEQSFYRDGEQCINFKTLVYQKGLDYIRKLLDDTKNIEKSIKALD